MLKRFANEYRLNLRSDECGDRVIPGRRGHLWFDGPELCLTILDGPPQIPADPLEHWLQSNNSR